MKHLYPVEICTSKMIKEIISGKVILKEEISRRASVDGLSLRRIANSEFNQEIVFVLIRKKLRAD